MFFFSTWTHQDGGRGVKPRHDNFLKRRMVILKTKAAKIPKTLNKAALFIRSSTLSVWLLFWIAWLTCKGNSCNLFTKITDGTVSSLFHYLKIKLDRIIWMECVCMRTSLRANHLVSFKIKSAPKLPKMQSNYKKWYENFFVEFGWSSVKIDVWDFRMRWVNLQCHSMPINAGSNLGEIGRHRRLSQDPEFCGARNLLQRYHWTTLPWISFAL